LLKSYQAVSCQQYGHGSITSMISSLGFLWIFHCSIVPSMRQTLNIFVHFLNIETLVVVPRIQDTPIEAPSSKLQHKITFMINSISTTNLEAKSKEFLEVLEEPYYPWFS